MSKLEDDYVEIANILYAFGDRIHPGTEFALVDCLDVALSCMPSEAYTRVSERLRLLGIVAAYSDDRQGQASGLAMSGKAGDTYVKIARILDAPGDIAAHGVGSALSGLTDIMWMHMSSEERKRVSERLSSLGIEALHFDGDVKRSEGTNNERQG